MVRYIHVTVDDETVILSTAFQLLERLLFELVLLTAPCCLTPQCNITYANILTAIVVAETLLLIHCCYYRLRLVKRV
jgi:hypothetical protein